MKKHLLKLTITALLWLGLSACAGHYEPFVGITTGKNQMNYTAVEALVYDNDKIAGGDVNGGCIPNTSSVDLEDVGKKRWGGGSDCGGFLLPVTWRPGLAVKVSWKVLPYPRWLPEYAKDGGLDQKQLRIMKNYDEYYTATIPLPPPPPKYNLRLGATGDFFIHFLACNQLMVSYGSEEEMYGKEYIKRDFDLFRKSQKLCSRRPVVKSMADYHKYKARMDAVKKEYASIPQVILPNYIQELKNSGQWPTTDNSKGK